MRTLCWLLLLASCCAGCVMAPPIPPGFSSTWQRHRVLNAPPLGAPINGGPPIGAPVQPYPPLAP